VFANQDDNEKAEHKKVLLSLERIASIRPDQPNVWKTFLIDR
jgi:hypothetical protein